MSLRRYAIVMTAVLFVSIRALEWNADRRRRARRAAREEARRVRRSRSTIVPEYATTYDAARDAPHDDAQTPPETVPPSAEQADDIPTPERGSRFARFRRGLATATSPAAEFLRGLTDDDDP